MSGKWTDTVSDAFKTYQAGRKLDEVEAIIPDLVGLSRGKAMPANKFSPQERFFLPVSLFYQTISGEYVDMEIENQWLEKDIVLIPDMATASAVPWNDEDVSLQVICDLETRSGEPLPIAPRNVLKNVVAQYAKHGWKPIVAPELEFYLTRPNTDPKLEIEPTVGRTGRRGVRQQAFSMVAIDDYGDVIDTIYDYAEAQGLGIDTLIQEGGAGQIEINLMHGDPVDLADQVFYFKRTIKEAALKHGAYATFMAKPMRDEPGSAMHIHQSIVDMKTGQNIFSDKDGAPTEHFTHFIGGSQKHLMEAVPLLAPYVNSFRRFAGQMSAPTNLEWAADNRTTGLRIPNSGPEARRVENRVTGSDTNPYLSIAASLAAGLIGMLDAVKPRREAKNEVWSSKNDLPRSLTSALDGFGKATRVREVLGEEFCTLYTDIKTAEIEEYQREISPWEREHLMLNT